MVAVFYSLSSILTNEKPMRTMEEKGGYRMAGAHLVSVPPSNSSCGACSFLLPHRTQPLLLLPHGHCELCTVENCILSTIHLTRLGCAALTPVPDLPFLGQFAKAGGYC